MDKSQKSSDRGGESSGNPYAKGGKAKPVKSTDMAKDALATLNKASKKAHKKGVAEGEVEESGLQAYLGKKKYGEQGMKALQKAGREGASKETMARIRAKHDRMDEEQLDEKAVSRAQQKFMGMVHAAKKGEQPASPAVATAAKGMSKKAARDFAATKHKGLPQHVNEAIHRAFKNGYSKEEILESLNVILESDKDYWRDLMKDIPEKGSTTKTVHKGHYGTEYQGDNDEDDDGKKKIAAPAGEKRGRGRPKGVKNRVVRAGEKKAATSGEKRGRGRPAGSKNKVKESWILENNKMIAEAFINLVEKDVSGVWRPGMPPPPNPDQASSLTPREQKKLVTPKTPDGGVGQTYLPQKTPAKNPALEPAPENPPPTVPGREARNPFPEVKEENMDLEEMMRLAGMEGKLHGKQHKLDVDKDGDIQADDLADLRASKHTVDEADMEEGNEFTGALDAARDAGEKSFNVDGKTYPVKESQLDECGEMGPMANGMSEQEGRMNVTTNMSTDGTKSVTVTADGNAALELMQILSLAGMQGHSHDMPESQVKVIPMEEAKDDRYHASTTPEEEVIPLETQLQGGDGEVAGKTKKMNKHGSARFSDNPLAAKDVAESISLSLMKEYESIKVK
jgi:hypothetical protein